MKTIFRISLIFLFTCLATYLQAQIINVPKRVENKVVNRVNHKIDRGIDKSLDAVENEVTGKTLMASVKTSS